MKKRTILYVGGFELPDKNAAAQRVLSVAKIFQELNFNVVFVGVDKSLKFDNNIENTKNLYFGFKSWSVPYPKNKKQWFKYITSISELKYLIEEYYKDDLYAIVCYNHPFISQFKIRQLCKINNAYYIPDVTEWYSAKGKSFLFGIMKWLDITLRMRYIHNKSDGIITTSKFLTGYYLKKNLNILELPSMFDSKQLDTIESLNQSKLDNTIYLMYAGSAYDENNPEKAKKNIKDRLDKVIILLNEMHKLNYMFIFNIFGLEKENYLRAFPEHKELLQGIGNKIIFHGKKKHNEIISYIKFSDFTIFLRDVDRVTLAGFPTKFSESLCCNTPVITNKISNIENYLNDGENGFYIDLKNQAEQVIKMKYIFSLKKEEINGLKKNCEKNKKLDYRKFLELTNVFFNNLKAKF